MWCQPLFVGFRLEVLDKEVFERKYHWLARIHGGILLFREFFWEANFSFADGNFSDTLKLQTPNAESPGCTELQ